LALGKFRNFNAKTDGLIAEADSSPDVSLNSLLYANNSSTVVIQHFDNGEEGQIVHLINLGSDLSFNGAQLKLSDSSNLVQNDNISFIYSNSSWYEINRNHSAALDTLFVSELPSDNAYFNAANRKVAVLNNSGATVIAGISGGYVGQMLTIVNIKSDATLSHNALMLNEGTGGVGFVLQVSGVVTLVHIKGGKWLPVREAYTGANPA
jgi:hypothetical protein